MEGEIQFTFTPVFTTSRQKHFWVVTTNLDSISYKTVSYFHLSKEILQWQVWIFAQEGSNNNGLKEVLKYKVQVIQSRRLLKLQSVFVPSSLSRRIKYQLKTSSLRHQKFLGYSPPQKCGCIDLLLETRRNAHNATSTTERYWGLKIHDIVTQNS